MYYRGGGGQSCKLLRHLGTSCQVGLETSSRISMVYPALFAMSRILKVSPALFGYFCTDNIFGLILDILRQILDIFILILANYGSFFLLLSVGFRLINQVPSRLRIICTSDIQDHGKRKRTLGGHKKPFKVIWPI